MSARKPALVGLEVLMIGLALLVVIPFLIILLNSFKDMKEAALFRLTLPSEWHFANYAAVFKQGKIMQGFRNSFFISGSVVFLVNLFASMGAFVIQRRNTKAMRTVYHVFIAGLIVPVSIVPTIKLMMDLGIHGTYLSIIMYYTAVLLPLSIFLLTGFMKSIPRELDEAALIEGCSYLRLYFRIVLPLLISVLVTVTIIVTISVWNDFFAPFYLVTDSTKWTVVLQVYRFVTLYSTNWGVVFAFIVIVVAPVLIVYLFLQRYIIDGLTAGSLKG